MKMKSTYQVLGWPDQIAITLFLLATIATLAPYISGIDLGVVKIPKLSDKPLHACRYFGPPLLLLSLVAFFPFWSPRLSKSELSMTLDIFSGAEQNTEPWRCRNTQLSYALKRANGELQIFPRMKYLERFNDGGPIGPPNDSRGLFHWDFPTIDIKIVNNTSHTIYLVEAVFHIDRSNLDPAPLLVPAGSSSNALHFALRNEGWGKAGEVKARFRLTPFNDEMSLPKPNFEEPYPHEVIIGDVVDFVNVSVASAFEKEGVDLKALASFQNEKGDCLIMSGQEFKCQRNRLLGPFKNGGPLALLQGELAFLGRSFSGETSQRQVKFSTIVWIYNEYLVGAGLPPSCEYGGVKFDFEGLQYMRRVPISQVLKPGESDRFTIKISVERSSVHNFVLELITNDAASLKSPPVVLHTFVPRFGARIAFGKRV